MSYIVEPARTIHIAEYARHFTDLDAPDSGFGFPCDKDGVIDRAALHPYAQANLDNCLDGTYHVRDEGVIDYSRDYRTDPILACDCGAHVALGDFTNTCEGCGADYNFAGQKLAARRFWGDDTLEHWSECL